MEVDFQRAWLLLDIVHKSVNVPEAGAIARKAKEELKSMSDECTPPPRIKARPADPEPVEPPAEDPPSEPELNLEPVRRV